MSRALLVLGIAALWLACTLGILAPALVTTHVHRLLLVFRRIIDLGLGAATGSIRIRPWMSRVYSKLLIVTLVLITAASTWWTLLALGAISYHQMFQPLRLGRLVKPWTAPDSGSLHLVYPGTSQETAVVVVFSGGGARSAVFSTSVLEYLNDPTVFTLSDGALLGDRIAYAAGVSGGALAAAAYVAGKGALHNQGAAGRKELFEDLEAQLAGNTFFTLAVGGFIAAFWPALATGDLSFSEATPFAWMMTGLIPRSATLQHATEFENNVAAGVPHLLVSVASLEREQLMQVSTHEVRVTREVRLSLEKGQLAYLVGCSAALPLISAPCPIGTEAGVVTHWVDGGLIDNLGLQASYLLITSLRRTLSGGRIHDRKILLIIVDAERIDDIKTRYGYLAGAWASVDLLGKKNPPRSDTDTWVPDAVLLGGQALNSLPLLKLDEPDLPYLGVIRLSLPDSGRTVPTTWWLSPQERRELSFRDRFRDDLPQVHAAILNFLSWRTGTLPLPEAHALKSH